MHRANAMHCAHASPLLQCSLPLLCRRFGEDVRVGDSVSLLEGPASLLNKSGGWGCA